MSGWDYQPPENQDAADEWREMEDERAEDSSSEQSEDEESSNQPRSKDNEQS